jgi:hypothetical protein
MQPGTGAQSTAAERTTRAALARAHELDQRDFARCERRWISVLEQELHCHFATYDPTRHGAGELVRFREIERSLNFRLALVRVLRL